MKKIAEVAVPVSLSLDETFDYAIDMDSQAICRPGCRVLVPFGQRRLVGYITSLKNHSPYKSRLKTILKVLDSKTPVLDERLMNLAAMVRETYFCSLAQAFDTVLPQAVRSALTEEEMPLQKIWDCPGLSKQEEKDVKGYEKKNVIVLEDAEGRRRWDFYKAWIKHVVLQQKSVLLLVSEFDRIRLAQERLNMEGLVITSQGQASKIRQAWFSARGNKPVLVIGTRSAIFAPLKNPGLIIIDDESHFAYRQQQVPNYHARDLALRMMHEEKLKVILGSSVPSLEAFRVSRAPDAVLVRLSKETHVPPALVDMRQEFAPRGRSKIVSKILEYRLNEMLEKRQNCMLFVDQKAFSTFLYCPKCKQTLHCVRCSSPLAFYRSTQSYMCPACGLKQEAGDVCPKCSSAYIRHRGFGEEKVESELLRLFPSVRIAHGTKEVPAAGSYDIMLAGPQILESAGFPAACFALVVVMNADHTLARPDFRATELAYGKFLRLSLLSSREFVAQTNVPDHYLWDFLKKQDTQGFLERELREREDLSLPPASWLGCLTLRAKNESLVLASAEKALKILKKEVGKNPFDGEIFGLQQAKPFQLRGYYRYQILLKYRDIVPLKQTLAGILKSRHQAIVTFDPSVY